MHTWMRGVVAGAVALAAAAGVSPAAGAAPSASAPIRLGDLDGAARPSAATPLDVCSPALWDGAPPEVRDPERDQGRPVDSGDPAIVMCALENDGPIGLQMDMQSGTASTTSGGRMAIYVAWGPSLGPLAGGQDVQFSGRPGRLLRDTDKQGQARCSTRVPLQQGTAGVMVLNTRFPDVDVCRIATDMSNHISTTMPR